MRRILFLYSEIADYFLASVEKLVDRAEVTIIHWPVNKEAPFLLSAGPKLKLINKSTLSRPDLLRYARNANPDIVVVSGWMDRDYLWVLRQLKSPGIRVLTMDNHWTGTWKQKIAAQIARYSIKRWFTHIWIPGKPQYVYANRLGFDPDHILQGFYCADTDLFLQTGAQRIQAGAPSKKVMLYVGRYVKHKGIKEMWDGFLIAANEPEGQGWELWCAGTGDEFEGRVISPKIKHFGFLQKDALSDLMKQASVYVLPSHFEPWGVAVHEAACAGFPLLLSDKVGAAERFLNQGINGFQFQAGDSGSIAATMLRMMKMSDEERCKMSEASRVAGSEHTLDRWANTLMVL